MLPITKIKLEKIKNSKNQDTIQATVSTKRSIGIASAPSGTSAGIHEAKAMPEGAAHSIAKAKYWTEHLINIDCGRIDEKLHEIDGTKDFSNIGASAAISISTAALKASAAAEGKQVYEYLLGNKPVVLPKLLGKCIGGGAHAKNSTSIQEFLSIPITYSAKKSVQVNRRVHHLVKRKLHARKMDYEGGWVARITDEKALDVMAECANAISRRTHVDVAIGIDVAASELYRGGHYVYRDKILTPKQQLDYMKSLVEDYGLYYIEDAFHEEDFKNFGKLTAYLKKEGALVCGDDLFTTNAKRLSRGVKEKACNSIIIKPNQIGTISDALEAVQLAKKHAYQPVLSHRSGETKDPVLSDLAVGWQLPFFKIGIAGAERTSKTDRLQVIEKKVKN